MKKEYVWKIYTDKNDHYYCERFPIVYQNKDIIYYKPQNTYYLQGIHRDSFDKYDESLHSGHYLTEPPAHIRVLLYDRTAQEIKRLEGEIRRYESYVEDAKRELVKSQNALLYRKEKLAELEGMKDS